MTKSNLFLFVGLAIVFALTGSQVRADGKRIPIHLKFAGAFSNTVVHDIVDFHGNTVRTVGALVHTLARGWPGRAVIRGMGGVSGGPPIFEPPCELAGGEMGATFPVAQNPLVITFVWDNSLLFGSGPGHVCVDFVSGKSEFEFELFINGGRGYFEGATGRLVVKGESEPVGQSFDPPSHHLNLNAETGTITGAVILP